MTTAFALVNTPPPSQTTGVPTTAPATTAPATTAPMTTGEGSSGSTTGDQTVPASSVDNTGVTPSVSASDALGNEAAAKAAASSSSGLNKGGIIALGIAIPSFLFALLLVVGVIWRYRRQREADRDRSDLFGGLGVQTAPNRGASSFNNIPMSMRSTEAISAQGSYSVFPSTSTEHMQLEAPKYSPYVSSPSQNTLNLMLTSLKPISARVPPSAPTAAPAPLSTRPSGQFSVGRKCLAMYSADGNMYKAMITAYEDGQYFVDYGASYNNEGEWVTPENISML